MACNGPGISEHRTAVVLLINALDATFETIISRESFKFRQHGDYFIEELSGGGYGELENNVFIMAELPWSGGGRDDIYRWRESLF
jgi:hypothetical protein